MVRFQDDMDQGTSQPPGKRKPLHTEESGDMEIPLSESESDMKLTKSVESFEVVSGASSSLRLLVTLEAPHFGHYQMLIAALLLTTLLAVGSALDAKNECINQEMYTWLLNLMDDAVDDWNLEYDDFYADFVSQEGRAECLHMFEYVIVPLGVATAIFGAISLYIIHRHLSYLNTISETFTPSHMGALLRLLVPLLIMLLVWTYAIFSIMLIPKVNPSLYNQNPFKSLAAVDQMGHIGDNANLYYLSWICQALIMVLVYQTMVECIRRFRRRSDQPNQIEENRSFADHITMHEQIQSMLSYTSAKRLASLYKKRRKKWYQFILHLRERSGYWVAAFFASLVLFASSSYVFVQVLVALARAIYGGGNFRYRDVCSIIRGTDQVPEEFCARASYAVMAGGIASCLCVVAIIMHLMVRRQAAANEEKQNSCSVMATQVLPRPMDPETTQFHLGMEFLLSLCLSTMLGLNAVVATGVQGPAATVGNLYYASWLSFLLSLRICLGCLEEIYHVRNSQPESTGRGNLAADSQKSEVPQTSSISEISINMDLYRKVAKKERSSRLRKYFFLSIFSSVCFASAWDAAYNQDAGWSRGQKYVIFAPAAVAAVSAIMFFLCLNPQTYSVVSQLWFGGLMSIVCFMVWLFDLVITMHSDDSWAVNSIGEMKLANLYYFSWASILAAALQMISYIKPLIGEKSKDAMFLVWASIVKVCMVILGAASHVWYNISDSCNNDDDMDGGEQTFCSRTRFAQVVGVVGVLSGWSVMGSRILGCKISIKTRSRVEAILSIMLVALFGVAVALITSIGGPGQSVGDLYYSTWLSFWVSMGIFVSCFDQIKQEQLESEVARYRNEHEENRYVDLAALDEGKKGED